MIRYILVIIYCSNILFAQVNWYWQIPEPHGNTLSSIKFIDHLDGCIVGDAGTVMRTSNGGYIWELFPNVTPQNLSSVFFINNLGWAVGEYGTIIKTTDGGSKWSVQNSGTDYNLTSVIFVDENKGWAIGGKQVGVFSYNMGVLLSTIDGGNNWTALFEPFSYLYLNAIYFKDNDNGYIITGPAGDIFETTDGGKNWIQNNNQYLHDQGIYQSFQSIYFVDDNTGWIVGKGNTILRTDDGGKLWQIKQKYSYSSSDNNLNSVYFVNKSVGWAAGEMATIIKTTDGGNTWQKQDSGLDKYLFTINSIYFKNENLGWAVSNAGVILITTNGGKTWLNNKNSTNKVNGIFKFFKDSYGYAFGNPGVLFKTEDNGNTWRIVAKDTTWTFTDGYFIDEYNGWAINGSYVSGSGGTYTTSDGGTTWTSQNNISQYWGLTGIHFVDKNIGNLIGQESRIFHTTDGGDTWTQVPRSFASVFCYAIDFFDKRNGIIVGQGNHVQYKSNAIGITSDGGENWNFTFVKGSGLKSIYMKDSTEAWVAGEDIRKTTDKGKTWVTKYTGEYINSISFSDSNNGYAIGNSGLMLYSSDGGNSWTKLNRMTSNNLYYITFSEKSTGWISGVNTLLTTKVNNNKSDTLLTNYSPSDSIIVDSTISTYLYQSYPNPFSSFTTIKYNLQKEEHVIIDVYDLLGREVATLLNGYEKAGIYNKIFDASKLPSGVYFYRMRAGGFSKTKKMTLLR
jgi:photosystem II stability/assembly factor-like uncharacterized protein